MGNRDHTTIIHGHDKIAEEILTNDSLANTIEILKKKLYPA
jgi:chromosomal replication initiator protein